MTMRTIRNAVVSLYKFILIALVVVMFLVVGLNVFSRYVLNASLGWADELSRFLFIYVSLLGAVLAYHGDEHVSLDLVVGAIRSRRVRVAVRIFGQALIVVALGFFAYYSLDVAISARNVSPALYIPMTIVYGVMPVAGALMFFMAIGKLLTIIKTGELGDPHLAEREALAAAEALKEEAVHWSKETPSSDASGKGR
ncbi:MAG: TRAP transporter small permease [Spirochaeta sp.]|nr:TRAP transporter small permease [Spirochaeta sp.]